MNYAILLHWLSPLTSSSKKAGKNRSRNNNRLRHSVNSHVMSFGKLYIHCCIFIEKHFRYQNVKVTYMARPGGWVNYHLNQSPIWRQYIEISKSYQGIIKYAPHF